MTAPPIVVMGVAGCGKTMVAKATALTIGAELGEADDLHPAANIDTMRRGVPLTDDARAPWLRAVGEWCARRAASAKPAVITCSALKRGYRDVLRAEAGELYFVHLSGDRALIAGRMRDRAGHFMPSSLLDSQLAILEPLEPDETGIELDVGRSPVVLARMAIEAHEKHTGELA